MLTSVVKEQTEEGINEAILEFVLSNITEIYSSHFTTEIVRALKYIVDKLESQGEHKVIAIVLSRKGEAN